MELETKKGFKQTEVGLIPEDWDVVTLTEAVEFLDGKRRPIKSSERISGDYPYYGASGIIDYVSDYIFDDELLLLGEDGENILSRNLPLAFIVKGKVWVNNHAHVMKPNSQFEIKFLAEYLESLDYELLNSGTAQPKLNKQSCSNIKIVKPTLEEQKAIATALSDVDNLITNLDNLIAKKKAIKQGAMQQLLTGKTRLSGFGKKKEFKQSEVGLIPEDWKLYQVNDLIDLLTDYDANGSFASVAENVNVYNNDNYAWYVRSTDLEKKSKLSNVKYVDKKSYKFLKKTALYGGELLFLKRGDIGNVYLFQMQTKHATVAPNLYLLKLNNLSNSTYLFNYFKSNSGQLQLKSKNASSTLGALYKDDVKSIYVPLPPNLEEQNAIANALEDMDKELEELAAKKEKYEHIKQGMMQELLTGKTRLV